MKINALIADRTPHNSGTGHYQKSQLSETGALCTMAPMRTRRHSILALLLFVAALSPFAHAAEKLKGFYSGSGGISAEVHRVLLVEFAADGTAILQQKWHNKDPQTWHANWKQDRNKVTITFDPAKHNPVPDPLILNIKHGTLIPASWDVTTLGVLGPPQLTPFGGNIPKVSSVASCQSLNTSDPTRDCVTWGSNR
jgi:hypothetical protein